MAVRTGYPGTSVATDVLTAANFNKLPGGWIGYVETITAQSGIGTSAVDLTSLTLTVTVGSGRRLRVSGFVPVTNAGASAQVEVDIYEGGTRLQRSYAVLATESIILAPAIVLTPTAGSHTYKLSGIISAGTYATNVAATYPAWLLVEDLGATP